MRTFLFWKRGIALQKVEEITETINELKSDPEGYGLEVGDDEECAELCLIRYEADGIVKATDKRDAIVKASQNILKGTIKNAKPTT